MEIRAAVGARDEPERLRQLTRGEQRDTADRPPRDRSTRGQAVLTLVVAIVVVQHPPRDARRTGAALGRHALDSERSEEHTSELQSRYVISYAVFCLKKKK